MHETPKTWNEFWAEFWRIRHLQTIPGIADWNRKLVDHIIAVLDLKPGSRVLDLASGSGEHAIELTRRGMKATGIDIAPVLINHARDTAQRDGLVPEFVVGDMRSIPHENEFDAVTILSGSFGFFDDDTNIEVLCQIARALKPGGKVYIQVPTPSRVESRTRRTWDRVDYGYVLMEETYDPETRRLGGSFRYITPDGKLITFAAEPDGSSASESMKLYTLAEYKSMFAAAGLEYSAAYGSINLPVGLYNHDSLELIAVATK